MKRVLKLSCLFLMMTVSLSVFADEMDNDFVISPLVFERFYNPDVDTTITSSRQSGLQCDYSWIENAIAKRRNIFENRYRLMVSHPYLVKYNTAQLPSVPQDVTIAADPSRQHLKIEPHKVIIDSIDRPADRREIKMHNWLHSVKGSLHFTQAYISDNWYQGGENNLNILGEFKWDFNLNTTLHPNWLFNNTLHYKLGVMRSHNDSLRNYTMSEDLFEFSSQLGYKAMKHWYYSANLLFKTQFFNNYKNNTNDLTASWLSPGELTVGLGMTYSYKDKEGIKSITLSIAPLSYHLKICRDIDRLDPTTFGIAAGHHSKHDFGSNIEGKFKWAITPNIEWISRLYVFTNYKYLQCDWENSLDFTINRYLSTRIFTHLRYDKSQTWDPDWRFWQFKEILSFGLTYKFSTN